MQCCDGRTHSSCLCHTYIGKHSDGKFKLPNKVFLDSHTKKVIENKPTSDSKDMAMTPTGEKNQINHQDRCRSWNIF